MPRAEQAFDDNDNLKDEAIAAALQGHGAAAGRTGGHDAARSGPVKEACADAQMEPRDRLIVALDVSSVEAAQAMVARLGDAVSFYKIGYQLAFAGGIAYAQR